MYLSDSSCYNNIELILLCRPDTQKKAKEFGEKLRNEDGVKMAVEAFHRKLPYHDGVWVEEIQENMRKGVSGWSGKGLLPLDRSMYTEKTGETMESGVSEVRCDREDRK